MTGTAKKIVGRAVARELAMTSGVGFSRQRTVVAPFSSGNVKLLPSP